jgi:hypothetical protein
VLVIRPSNKKKYISTYFHICRERETNGLLSSTLIESDRHSPVVFEQTDGFQIAVMACVRACVCVYMKWLENMFVYSVKELRLIPSGKDNNERKKKRPKTTKFSPCGFFFWFFALTDYQFLLSNNNNNNNTRSGSLECYATDWLSKKKKKGKEREQTDRERERAWYSTVNTRVFLRGERFIVRKMSAPPRIREK